MEPRAADPPGGPQAADPRAGRTPAGTPQAAEPLAGETPEGSTPAGGIPGRHTPGGGTPAGGPRAAEPRAGTPLPPAPDSRGEGGLISTVLSLETAAPSRVNFREIKGWGYLMKIAQKSRTVGFCTVSGRRLYCFVIS